MTFLWYNLPDTICSEPENSCPFGCRLRPFPVICPGCGSLKRTDSYFISLTRLTIVKNCRITTPGHSLPATGSASVPCDLVGTVSGHFPIIDIQAFLLPAYGFHRGFRRSDNKRGLQCSRITALSNCLDGCFSDFPIAGNGRGIILPFLKYDILNRPGCCTVPVIRFHDLFTRNQKSRQNRFPLVSITLSQARKESLGKIHASCVSKHRKWNA